MVLGLRLPNSMLTQLSQRFIQPNLRQMTFVMSTYEAYQTFQRRRPDIFTNEFVKTP